MMHLTKQLKIIKKKKSESGNENFKVVVDRGTERGNDYLEGNNRQETYTTTTLKEEKQPPQQPTVIQTVSAPPPPVVQQTVMTPPMMTPPMMSPPVMQQTVMTPTMMSPPVMQQTTVGYNPYGFQPQVFTNYTPPMTPTGFYSSFGPTVTTGVPMNCQFCRLQFSASPGGLVRCPFCQQINTPFPTAVTFTTPPIYY